MEEIKSVKKAVIPVAGFGTRMLPATKAVPKELLPILDKPLIQHILEEAASGGIEEIILITRSGKEAIENHLDNNFELENLLKKSKKDGILKKFPKFSLKNLSVLSIRQEKPLGLGHAIFLAKPALRKDEPFAVFLPDEFLISSSGKTDFQEMVDNFKISGRGQVLVEKIDKKNAVNYGIVDLNKKRFKSDTPVQISNVIEKPSFKKAPSNFRIVGRYIFPYRIMNYLEKIKPGRNNELQLTDALSYFIKMDEIKMDAVLSNSKIFDCGTLKGFIGANVSLASKDKLLKKYMEEIII